MKSNKLIYIIENIAISILIAINVVPEMTNKYVFLFGIVLLCIVNFKNDKNFFINFFFKKNFFMYSIYLWCIFNVILFAFGYDNINFYYLLNYFRISTVLTFFVYYSKKNDNKILKNIAIITSILLIIVCVRTITLLYTHKNISRLLATGIEIKSINTFGVGGYAFIYGLSFVVVALVGILVKDKRYKNMSKENICLICMILLFIFTIYKAQYLISYIILAIGMLIIFFNVNSLKKIAISILILIISLFILAYPMSKLLIKISNNMKNESIKMRIIEIAMVLSGEDVQETVDLNARLKHYRESIDTFTKHPFFGNLFNQDGGKIGGHSFIFDQFAEYGVIGSIPIIIMLISVIYYTFYELNSQRNKEIYMACIVMFVILAITNTIKFVTIFYLMFVFNPTILKISGKEENYENSLDS